MKTWIIIDNTGCLETAIGETAQEAASHWTPRLNDQRGLPGEFVVAVMLSPLPDASNV